MVITNNIPIPIPFGSYPLPTRTVKEEESEEDRQINKIGNQSKNILMTVSAIFPFDLFPDKIIVDEAKVRIFIKKFFFTEEVAIILLENITDVEVTTSPFFATIKLRDATYFRFPRYFQIGFLKKKEAFELAKLIQGLIEAKKAQVDYSNINPGRLVQELETAGDVNEN